jgi:hypothetical protein
MCCKTFDIRIGAIHPFQLTDLLVLPLTFISMAGQSEKNTSGPVDLLMVTRPNMAEAVPGLLKEVIKGVESLTTGTDEHRKDLLVKCRALTRALETPRETMADHCWGQVSALHCYCLNRISDMIDGCNRCYRFRRGLGIMGVDGSEWR